MEPLAVQRPAVIRATLTGMLMQLAMVIAGHFSPGIANAFAAGGMAISAVAGLLYAFWGLQGTAMQVAAGGAMAGAGSALPGIIVSYLLGDVPAAVLGFGTASSGVTGVIGALLGRALSRGRTR
jgi:hypothetical protein